MVELSDRRIQSAFIHAPSANEAHAEPHALVADGALRASEERYRLLFDAIPLPVFVWEESTFRFLAVNDACVRRYGWSRAEMLAMTVDEIRPPDEVERFKRFAASLRRGNVFAGVWTHWDKQGAIFEAEVTTHAVEFSGQSARLSVINDVTESRRLEEQLRQSQKIEATGLLAGGIAHDFNNLLGVVIGASELARRAPSPSAFVDYLDEIEGAAKRAAELTRKLLAFSRKQVMKMRPLDLGEAIDDFLSLLRRVIGEDIELVVRGASQPLVVEADMSQLEQVLLNLCTNARQAMPTGGRIVLELRRTSFDASECAREPWARPGDYAEVRVVDSGVGMDTETQARMFEPFFTTKDAGTGLGLSMVHGIVHQHRGLLRVHSRLGEGTTVRIFLPLSEVLEARETKAPSRLPAEGGGETLLVAEDEPALRRMLASTLTELGYDVVVAQDGEEAIRALEARGGQVAMAVLDVVMPKLGGLGAYAQMCAIQPGLKALFISGYAPESAQVGELLTAGGHVLLTKPFSLKELARNVRQTLDMRDRPNRTPTPA